VKKFTKNNTGFVCEHCGRKVIPHPKSSRDHCTECLYSKHVDINPGDRMNECSGLMEPIGIRMKSGIKQIVYKCLKCDKKGFNITAPDDNPEFLMKLGTKSW
jgi:DNA-directed RNA polymerase subunit RPC12/RpoP